MPSSVICSFNYDAERRQLSVVFVSGKLYRYRDVPPAIYAAFARSQSKGTFFNTFIRNRYAFERAAVSAA